MGEIADDHGFNFTLSGLGRSGGPPSVKCMHCRKQITFHNRKPFNANGTSHRCLADAKAQDSKDAEISLLKDELAFLKQTLFFKEQQIEHLMGMRGLKPIKSQAIQADYLAAQLGECK